MLWSYFPALSILEFINKYLSFFSEQPFPSSPMNFKDFCLLWRYGETQNYISTISWNIHHMYFSYGCILLLSFKNWIPCQGSPFTQSRSLNGILLLTHDRKINKSSFDMKQSVVSKGSQYILAWYVKKI